MGVNKHKTQHAEALYGFVILLGLIMSKKRALFPQKDKHFYISSEKRYFKADIN